MTYFARVESEVQLEHVDAGLAEEAERASVGVLLHEREDARERQVACRGATRAAWIRASAGEMCGSSPDPEDVTASTGTGRAGGETVLVPVRDDPCRARPW